MEVKEFTGSIKDFDRQVDHPLQSWAWGEFREKLGQKVIRAGVFQRGELVSAFQVFLHQIPPTPFLIGYLPKGPLPSREIIDFLKKIGQKEKVIFFKLEPNVVKKEGESTNFQKLDLVKGKPIFTKYTSVIDLCLSEEELLARISSKTRYNIRLSQKHRVIVREDNSPQTFKQYLKLLLETTKRQGFYAHNEKFHQTQWRLLKQAGIPHLLVAKYENQYLAAFLLFVFKNTLYYPYGASTREHKELMAPTLLMWEAIRFGKRMGLKKFDLWGDIEPNPPPGHPYYGFHRFKEGFSPKLVEFIGTYDLVINPLLYQIYKLSDFLRWKILRLKTKIR